MAEKTKSLEKTPQKTPEASPPSRSPAPSVSPSGFGLAAIQGAAGNMAMQHAAREVGGQDVLVHPESALNFLSVRSGAVLLQRKLTIGSVNDPLEHEADRVAERVMRMPARLEPIDSSAAQVQRKCACGGTCDSCRTEEEQWTVQRKSAARPPIAAAGASAATTAMSAPPIVHDVLRSPGQPLPSSVRTFFEPRFGADFSHVRVHTDGAAQRSAQDMNANAYTVGQNVVFGTGRFAPDTQEGRQLLAHELTHVVQQQGAGPALIQRQCGGRPMPPCPTEWVSRPSSSDIGSAFGHWLGLQYRDSHTISSYLLVDWWIYGSRGKIGTISGSLPGGRRATGLADIDPAVLNALQATPDWNRSRTHRTDILASDTDEVFEIKPIRGAGAGPAQLAGYLTSLRAVAPTAPSTIGGGRARNWQPGRWDPVPHLLPVPVSPTEFCVICTWADPDNAGVLVYDLLCCDNREPPEEKEPEDKPKDKEPPEQGPGASPLPIPSLPELLTLGAKVAALLLADGLLSAALSFVGSFALALTPFLALAALAVGIVFLADKIKSIAHMIAGAAKFVWDTVSSVVALVRDTLKAIGKTIGELAVVVGGLIKDLAEAIAEGLLAAGRGLISGAKWLGGRIAEGAEAVWDWLFGSDVEPMIPNIELPITEEPTMRCGTVAREDALIQIESDILFPFREWELTKLTPEGHAALLKAAAKVLFTPRTDDPIRFLGFTDVIGDPGKNQTLSEQRAAAVADWFVQHGIIPRSKVEIRGLGETEAQAQANDEEGRKKDRRVDILVTKKGSSEKVCW